MKKNELITDAAYDRLLRLTTALQEQTKAFRYHGWHLISAQEKIVVPGLGLIGIEVNGADGFERYFAVDFYEEVNDDWKRCWHFRHRAESPDTLRADIAANLELLRNRKIKDKRNQKRRKYRKGDVIRSVDDLLKQEFVYFDDKIYHCGWVRSWQLNMVVKHMENGRIFYAIQKENSHE